MLENYLVPTNIIVFLGPCRFRPYFDVGNVSAPGSGRKSVSGDDSSLELLGLEPTTQSTISLCESVSTSDSDQVACWLYISEWGLQRLLTPH